MTHSLFLNRGCADITIKLADGTEYAHKSVLVAASSVFDAMLSRSMGMQEGQTDTINLPDTKLISMRVFLRLLYTGQTDPNDWNELPVSVSVPPRPTRPPTRVPETSSNNAELALEYLIEVAVLARKYMVDYVTVAAVDALKFRLYKAASNCDMAAFEEVWKHAIQARLDTLRMVAIQMVKDTLHHEDREMDWIDLSGGSVGSLIKEKYDAKALSPEALFELQAIWAAPYPVVKMRRLL